MSFFIGGKGGTGGALLGEFVVAVFGRLRGEDEGDDLDRGRGFSAADAGDDVIDRSGRPSTSGAFPEPPFPAAGSPSCACILGEGGTMVKFGLIKLLLSLVLSLSELGTRL